MRVVRMLDHHNYRHQSEIGFDRVQQNLQKFSNNFTTTTTTMITLCSLLLTASLILCQEVENPETSELFKPINIPIFNVIKKPRVTFRKTVPRFNKIPTRYSPMSLIFSSYFSKQKD